MALAKANTKVKLLVNTAYQGPRKEGDVILVPEGFANRWVKNGIAELVSDEVDGEGDEVITEEPENEPEESNEVQEGQEPEVEAVDYASMKAKELYDLCVEKGIEVEAKKSKEYYIEKLNEAE